MLAFIEAHEGSLVTTSGGTQANVSAQIAAILERQVVGVPNLSSASREEMVEPLTPRELEILALVSKGLSNKEISSELGVATNTVKTHLQACYGKLGVSRRTQAILRLSELGIVTG